MDNFNKILKENREKRRIFLKEEAKKERKKRKKETILTIIIASFILIITLICLYQVNKNFMINCINNGYSQLYCEKEL